MENDDGGVLAREREYHEKLYSGFAQRHFARPAVRAFRSHLARRILRITGAGRSTQILSLGCGIADTELLLAPSVAGVTGLDLSPSAIRQARSDAQQMKVTNATFLEGTLESVRQRFDLVIAIFFLHHLPDRALERLPGQIAAALHPSGLFYSLDPSSRRLSGAIGRTFIPSLMRKYQTADERELEPEGSARLFRGAGFHVTSSMYDFASTPLAGLFPGWRVGYQAARAVDNVLVRTPVIKTLGSNFELLARPIGS